MCFVESIAAARAFARPGEPTVDADRELIALGAASVGGGLFRAYPTGGGLWQTAVNRAAGARTQVSSVVTAGLVCLTLTSLTPLVANLPQAVLGAIVLVAAVGLVDIAALQRFARIRRREVVLALVTLGAVVVLGVLKGGLVGVLASMLALIYEADHESVGVLVIDASAIPDFEITALRTIADLVHDLASRGVEVRVALLGPRPRQLFERTLANRQTAGRHTWRLRPHRRGGRRARRRRSRCCRSSQRRSTT
jgi:MFS superfamily sulfate permease-like transporter